MNQKYILFSLVLVFSLLNCQQHNEAGTESSEGNTPAVLPPAEPLEKRLTYGDYQLVAKTTEVGSQTSLAIRGLVGENPLSSSINFKVERIADVEIADLNEDGQPEVYAFDHSADGHFYGRIIAFEFTPQGAWSEIAVESLPERFQQEYQGHDQFRIEQGEIVRTFPTYRKNGKKTGKERAIHYSLKKEPGNIQLRVSD